MSNEDRNLTPQQQKDLDKVNWRIEFQKKLTEDLNTNESIQNYFKNYHPDSVKLFITNYLQKKTLWHEFGDFWIGQKEKDELHWIEAAFWHLSLIQQKKLFDIQCLWRAEQVQIPEVKLCCEFRYWEENVLNCPFIDPITKDEVELYQQYLQGNNVELKEDFHFLLSFQDYEEIKDAYQSDDAEFNFPEWYEFYNGRKGTAVYMELPDIRGDKERYYIRLARTSTPEKKEAAENASAIYNSLRTGKPMPHPGNALQHLNAFSEETIKFFVETFEDKQTKNYYKAYLWNNRNSEEEDRIKQMIDFLLEADEPVPMEAHYDWKVAIENAVRRHTINKISEYLPDAYEQYMLTISMNISAPENAAEHINAARKILLDDILLGRKLNGEPEDLNF